MGTSAASIKDEAHRLIDQLSDDASWEDLMYAIYVREAVERGLQDVAAGRVVDHATVRESFGLKR
ncbi:MAG: hypothetical protein HY875_05005 [Chloroflexi bacterium]|nr:hypothetical protein [Chloroflexota bacterium]